MLNKRLKMKKTKKCKNTLSLTSKSCGFITRNLKKGMTKKCRMKLKERTKKTTLMKKNPEKTTKRNSWLTLQVLDLRIWNILRIQHKRVSKTLELLNAAGCSWWLLWLSSQRWVSKLVANLQLGSKTLSSLGQDFLTLFLQFRISQIYLTFWQMNLQICCLCQKELLWIQIL